MERKTIHWIEIIKLKIVCYNYIIGFIFMTAQHEVWERQRNFYWLRPKGNYSAGLMRHLGAVMHCYHQREVHGPVIKWTKGMKEYFMHAVLHWTLQQAALKIALCTTTAIEDSVPETWQDYTHRNKPFNCNDPQLCRWNTRNSVFSTHTTSYWGSNNIEYVKEHCKL